MSNLLTVELEGPRLLMRAVRPEDADELFASLYQREEILRWLLWDGPTCLEDTREYCSRWRVAGPEHAPDEGVDHRLLLFEREGERQVLCGGLSLRWSASGRLGDLGYWIEPRRWGQGLATEAIGLLCTWAFGSLEASVLVARVFQGNTASERALERNGFVFTHLAPASATKRGRLVDLRWHALSSVQHAALASRSAAP